MHRSFFTPFWKWVRGLCRAWVVLIPSCRPELLLGLIPGLTLYCVVLSPGSTSTMFVLQKHCPSSSWSLLQPLFPFPTPCYCQKSWNCSSARATVQVQGQLLSWGLALQALKQCLPQSSELFSQQVAPVIDSISLKSLFTSSSI